MAQLALIERQASALRTGFIPPDKPSVCFMCFTNFYSLCFGCPEESGVARITSKCAPFLDALMCFVMAEGFTEDRRAIMSNQLVQNWTRCQKCRPPTLALNRARSRSTSLFDDFFYKCCGLVNWSMASLPSFVRRPFRTKAGSWPTRSDQILPYGAAVCVSNLVTTSYVCVSALSVLGMALLCHRSLVFEEALHHRERILQRCIMGLQSAKQILQNLSSSPSREQRNIDNCEGEGDDSKFASALESVHVYPALLETMFFGTGARPGDHRRLTIGHEDELYRAIVDVLTYFDNVRAWTQQLADVAGLLYIRLPASGRRDPPQFIRDRAILSAMPGMQHPYFRLVSLLPTLNARQSCSGPDCGRDIQSGESHKPFPTCARCRMVLYCSRECQRADWKHDPNPHKEICDILNELCAIVNPKSPVFEFVDACQERQFPLERAQRLAEWICGSSTTVDADAVPLAYKEILTETIGAAEEAGLEEEVSEDRVTLDYYCHYISFRIKQ